MNNTLHRSSACFVWSVLSRLALGLILFGMGGVHSALGQDADAAASALGDVAPAADPPAVDPPVVAAPPVPAPVDTPPVDIATPSRKLVDFAKDIAPILLARCASCHEGEGAKGGFFVGDRDTVLGYVQSGSSSDSALWTDYLMADPMTLDKPSLIMPPDGPLPRGELALLKLWLDEGAEWPEGMVVGSKVEATAGDGGELSLSQRVFRAIGYFHPAIVHFPIALISVAAASVVLSYLFGPGFARFAYACLVIGALFAVISAVMGWSFAETRGFSSWSQMITAQATEEESNQFFHRWLGTVTAVLGLVVCIAGWRSRQSDGSRPGHFWRLGTLILALLVGIVGHQGGELVYGDIFGKALEQFSK
jgi:uncharacterized membrane protein